MAVLLHQMLDGHGSVVIARDEVLRRCLLVCNTRCEVSNASIRISIKTRETFSIRAAHINQHRSVSATCLILQSL